MSGRTEEKRREEKRKGEERISRCLDTHWNGPEPEPELEPEPEPGLGGNCWICLETTEYIYTVYNYIPVYLTALLHYITIGTSRSCAQAYAAAAAAASAQHQCIIASLAYILCTKVPMYVPTTYIQYILVHT